MVSSPFSRSYSAAASLLTFLAKHGNKASVAAIKRKADAFALDVASIITDIEATGITSNLGISAELKRREIQTARGSVDGWTDTTVARIRGRLQEAG